MPYTQDGGWFAAHIGRFMQYVAPEPNSGCWLWAGACTGRGYGGFKAGGKTHLAHRFAYLYFKGPINPRLEIDHVCRVRCCVTPAHLEAVTHSENCVRGASPELARQRQKSKTHCPQGHAYDEKNTYRYKGGRSCRACNNRYTANYRAKQKLKQAKFAKEGNSNE